MRYGISQFLMEFDAFLFAEKCTDLNLACPIFQRDILGNRPSDGYSVTFVQ